MGNDCIALYEALQGYGLALLAVNAFGWVAFWWAFTRPRDCGHLACPGCEE